MSYFLPTHSGAMTGEIVEPHKLLVREMERLGLGPVAFAKKIGVDYQTLARWRRGKFFNEENQELCALGLGRPPDFFHRPDMAEVLRRKRAEVFKAWLDQYNARKDAHVITRSEQAILQRMMEADPTRVPLPEWFTVQIGIHRGNLTEEQAEIIEQTTRELDEEIARQEREARAKPLTKMPAKKTGATKKSSNRGTKSSKKPPAP